MNHLAVIMPVYNEEEAIRGVLTKWIHQLEQLDVNYTIFVYNDGSKDHTDAILNQFATNHPHIHIYNQTNCGHGPTILRGYVDHSDCPWIFQTDSDDEMSPSEFHVLWNQRNQYDFLIGRRSGRNSSLSRKLISLLSRWTVHWFYGSGVYDVNSPYRLMRTEIFRDLFKKIPKETFAPNLIITGHACKKNMRMLEVDIPYNGRQTGTVSIQKWKLIKAALTSFKQTIGFA